MDLLLWRFSIKNIVLSDYAVGRQNGWISANDIRELEDMNKIPEEEGGDNIC